LVTEGNTPPEANTYDAIIIGSCAFAGFGGLLASALTWVKAGGRIVVFSCNDSAMPDNINAVRTALQQICSHENINLDFDKMEQFHGTLNMPALRNVAGDEIAAKCEGVYWDLEVAKPVDLKHLRGLEEALYSQIFVTRAFTAPIALIDPAVGQNKYRLEHVIDGYSIKTQQERAFDVNVYVRALVDPNAGTELSEDLVVPPISMYVGSAVSTTNKDNESTREESHGENSKKVPPYVEESFPTLGHDIFSTPSNQGGLRKIWSLAMLPKLVARLKRIAAGNNGSASSSTSSSASASTSSSSSSTSTTAIASRDSGVILLNMKAVVLVLTRSIEKLCIYALNAANVNSRGPQSSSTFWGWSLEASRRGGDKTGKQCVEAAIKARSAAETNGELDEGYDTPVD